MNTPRHLPIIIELSSAESRMLSSSSQLLTRFSLWIAVWLLIGMTLKVSAASPFGIPYRFVSDSGSVFGSKYYFTSAPYLLYSANETCPGSHKDPDGNNYEHGHSWEAFGLFLLLGEVVSVAKSDAAWDQAYWGYVRQSPSSFMLNCYAHTVGAPTPMTYAGWISWTDSSTLCDSAAKAHSYYAGNDHVKNYGITLVEASCIVSTTQEKNASSGVYTIGWTLPFGGPSPSGQMRKRK